MAKIQLGEGKEYEGTIAAATPMWGTRTEVVTVVFSTLRGDDQVNFPVSITLSHDEALKLVASVCNALTKQAFPPQSSPVDFGDDVPTGTF